MAHVEQQANKHGRSLCQITTSAFVTCDPVATPTNVYTTVYTTTTIAASPTASWIAAYTITEVCTGWPWEYKTKAIPSLLRRDHHLLRALRAEDHPIICPIPTPTANVVINGNGVTDAANPVITGAGDGANYQHGGGQTGGGSNPGGNGQNNNPNGVPSGSAGQAPGYGVYGSYGSYGQGASAQPGQSGVPGAPAPGQPGAAGAGGQPDGQPGQSAVPGAPGAPGTNPATPPTVVVASAPSFKKSLGLLCAIAMAVGLTALA